MTDTDDTFKQILEALDNATYGHGNCTCELCQTAKEITAIINGINEK